MIGYEIKPRAALYSECPYMDLVINKIHTEGQKPDSTRFNEIGRNLEDNPNGSFIFRKLQETVYQC